MVRLGEKVFPHTNDSERLYTAKQHFLIHKRQLPRDQYLAQVDCYDRVHKDFFALPPCRLVLTVPLLPSKVPGLLGPEDLTTPRTGGRRGSRQIHERNEHIVKLKQAGCSHKNICRDLDQKKFPTPDEWRAKEIYTWQAAYATDPQPVHKLMSTAKDRLS